MECSEGEFLVKKIMSWEGVRKEFVEAICNFAVNLIPNSHLTLNFGTKNSPSGLFGIWKNIFQTSTVFDLFTTDCYERQKIRIVLKLLSGPIFRRLQIKSKA